MDDYEAQKIQQEDHKEQYEYSDANLSNVFNLEGEDYSNRYQKKVKDMQGNITSY